MYGVDGFLANLEEERHKMGQVDQIEGATCIWRLPSRSVQDLQIDASLLFVDEVVRAEDRKGISSAVVDTSFRSFVRGSGAQGHDLLGATRGGVGVTLN